MSNTILKIQRLLTYLVILTAILIFILSLGFITNFYQLFYEGTSEMYDFYNQLQYFNKVFFNVSIIVLVASLLLLSFDFLKKRPGIIGLIFVVGITVYVLTKAMVFIGDVQYYQDIYLNLDFSSLDDYNVSTMPFSLTKFLLGIDAVLYIGLAVTSIIHFVKGSKKGNKKEVQYSA